MLFHQTCGQLPPCDFCAKEGVSPVPPARYDFKTKLPGGPWGNGCAEHYLELRQFDMLGEGKAQVLCVPRPGSMVGNKIALLPFSKRPVYKPAFLFVLEEDTRGWKGLVLNDRGLPTQATVFDYPRSHWRDGRASK